MIKKKFLAAVMIAAAVCVMGGCGNSKKSAENTAAEATTEAAATTVPIEINASEYVKLGDYKGLTIDGASTTVTDDEVEEEINTLLQDYTDYKEIKRKTVKDGDYVNVDCAAEIDGEENEDYSESDMDILMGEGDLNVADDVDVDEKVIGAKVGDTVTVDFTFPDDYDDDTVAGKKCTLSISVNAVEKEVVPELTDAFIKENTGVKTVKAYRKQVREELEDTKKTEAEQTNEETLWSKIKENATQIKDFPDDIVQTEISNITVENEDWAEYFGLSLEEYIEQYYEMSLTDYAKDTLKDQCIQDLLVEAEGIEVSDQDIEDEIQTYMDDYGYESKEEILEVMSEDDIRSDIEYTQLMEKLMKETTVK